MLQAGMIAVTLMALSFAAQAGTWEGVAIGAGSGAVIVTAGSTTTDIAAATGAK
jgi:hypothetical protein